MSTSIFNLTNVKCAGCVGKVQSKVMALTAVSKAQVNLLDKTLVVDYHDNKDDQSVIDALANIGYGASLDKIEERKTSLWLSVVMPFVLAIVMMVVTMSHQLHFPPHDLMGLILGLAYAVVSLSVVLG